MTTDKIKLIFPFIILLVAVVATVLLINSRPEAKQQEIVREPPLVDVLVIDRETVRIPVVAQGSVMPRTETSLVSEVAGRVTEVATGFNAGGFFKKGAVLMQIDQRDYQANVKRAKASLASARSKLATEKGQSEVAFREWKARGTNTKRSESATDLYLRKPQLEEAQANLEFAKAEFQQAQTDLENTTIRAPFDCMVRSKSVDIGQYVSTGANLANVFAVDSVEVRLPLPEYTLRFLNLPRVNAGATETENTTAVVLSATVGRQTKQWQGELIRTEGVLDAKTRTMMAVVRVNDPYGVMGDERHQQTPLRVGTFVTATIQGKPIDGVASIPQGALRPGNKVWLVDDKQRLRSHAVDVLRTVGDTAYIDSGLKDGMRISSAAISSFVPGTEVRIASTKEYRPAASKARLELSAEQPAEEANQVTASATAEKPE